MPASIDMSNYYFHQISSFCCFNMLLYYAALIAGGTYRSLVTPLWQDRPKGFKPSRLKFRFEVQVPTSVGLDFTLWWL